MADETKKRSLSYARISYYDPDSDSLKSQLEMCREYAATHGYQVIAELTEDDRGASGADFDLPALNRALELARNDKIDVLVTREMDRFARGLAKQLLTEREFNQAGVEVLYVIGDYEDSPEGQLTKHVRAIIAEYEREKINERMIRGRLRSVRRGNILLGGNIPFGYRLIKVEKDGRTTTTLVPYPEEAEWIRKIFQWYVYGDGDEPPMSMRKVAKKLTDLGVLSATDRGNNAKARRSAPGRWYASYLCRILANRTYIGEWTYRSVTGDIIVNVEPILDKALFDKAQKKRISAQRMSPRNTKNQYLFRGRVACAMCGWNMYSTTSERRGAENKLYRYSYYLCPGARDEPVRKRRCPPSAYRSDSVDEAVWNKLRSYLLEPRLLDEAFESADQGDGAEQIKTLLFGLDQRIDEQKQILSRFLDLYGIGRFTMDALMEKQDQVNADIERLQDERARLVAQLDDAVMRQAQGREIIQYAEAFRAGVKDADEDFDRRRRIIDGLDVTIKMEKIHDDESATATKPRVRRSPGKKVAHIYLGDRYVSTTQVN